MYEDKELQEYRDLLQTPDHFEEGFDWKTVVGSIFIGFLMMPDKDGPDNGLPVKTLLKMIRGF